MQLPLLVSIVTFRDRALFLAAPRGGRFAAVEQAWGSEGFGAASVGESIHAACLHNSELD